MKLAEEIDEMEIEQVRADFYTLMNEIVVEHGDNQAGTTDEQEEEATDAE